MFIFKPQADDQSRYQEMVAHLGLNSHENPKSVLIIGGGDGGVAREIQKHPTVESVVLCEIDELVIHACKKYLPDLAEGLNHPKLEVVIQDGFEYLNGREGQFDVVITDSSNPVGPAEVLFQYEYFQLLQRALKSGGVIVTIQGKMVPFSACCSY
jgi:spermidine synthase